MRALGWAVGALFVLALAFVLYTLFVWGPQHNYDRCAQGYKYAADGQLCP